MANFLFAALSLVSSFSKGSKDDGDLKSLEVAKNNEVVIYGTYSNVNSMMGLEVTGTGTEDYFYSLELDPDGHVYRSGSEIPFSGLEEGDRLKVTYDGSVSLVYPPKLNHVTRIDVVDDGKTDKKAS